MSRSNPRSQTPAPYDISLLNDLHEIVPEFLYEDEMFNSPLVRFFQTRVSHMFPSYHRERTHYLRTQSESRNRSFGTRSSIQPASNRYSVPTVTTTSTSSTAEVLRALLLAAAIDNAAMESETDPIPGLTTTGPTRNGPRTRSLNAWLEPVIVRPSAEVYSENTDILPESSVSEDTICAICQRHDHDIPEMAWRKLRRCGHMFHTPCADRWFLLNINCPLCRADIRLPATQNS
jgi:hypothetical protein